MQAGVMTMTTTSNLTPFEGGKFRVTSIIGYRTHPITGAKSSPHYGLDLVGESSKNIIAIAPGIVGYSGIVPQSSGDATWQWGNYVRIDGDDGYKYYYCHMSKRLVTVGQRVKVGDILGVEGATGQATGSHLHLEKRKGARKCLLPAADSDDCNVATQLGIPNVVGSYEVADKTTSGDKPSDWAAEAWQWGIDNGITDGTRPQDNITREQVVTMLYRYDKLK